MYGFDEIATPEEAAERAQSDAQMASQQDAEGDEQNAIQCEYERLEELELPLDGVFAWLVVAISNAFPGLEIQRFMMIDRDSRATTWTLNIEPRYQCDVLYLRQAHGGSGQHRLTVAWKIDEFASRLYRVFADWMVAESGGLSMAELARRIEAKTAKIASYLKEESAALEIAERMYRIAKKSVAVWEGEGAEQ